MSSDFLMLSGRVSGESREKGSKQMPKDAQLLIGGGRVRKENEDGRLQWWKCQKTCHT